MALTHEQADADDLVQDTYLRALRHWNTFVPGTDCRRWLATICRNAFYEKWEKKNREQPAEDEQLESLAAAALHNGARAAGVEDMFDRLDLGPAIMNSISRLDPVFRSVITLSDVEGFSYQEIADTLSIPIGTVRSRLYRGRRLLQEALIDFAIDAGFTATVTINSTSDDDKHNENAEPR